jgi:hypothetical protein
MNRGRLRIPAGRWAVGALLLLVCHPAAFCQRAGTNPYSTATPSAITLVNVGGGPMESQFESMDFAQKLLDQQNRNPTQKERERGLVDSGSLSALDLAAPPKAINEFNQASALLRGQHSQEAIGHLADAADPAGGGGGEGSAQPVTSAELDPEAASIPDVNPGYPLPHSAKYLFSWRWQYLHANY